MTSARKAQAARENGRNGGRPVGPKWTREDWLRKHLATHPTAAPRPKPTCHPTRPYKGRGLCRACYRRWWKAQRQMAQDRSTLTVPGGTL